MEELPPQITTLKKLKNLYINEMYEDPIIKRVPRDITKLPCWKESVEKECRKLLQFYDTVCMINPSKTP